MAVAAFHHGGNKHKQLIGIGRSAAAVVSCSQRSAGQIDAGFIAESADFNCAAEER